MSRNKIKTVSEVFIEKEPTPYTPSQIDTTDPTSRHKMSIE